MTKSASFLPNGSVPSFFVRKIHPHKDNCDFYTFKPHMRYVQQYILYRGLQVPKFNLVDVCERVRVQNTQVIVVYTRLKYPKCPLDGKRQGATFNEVHHPECMSRGLLALTRSSYYYHIILPNIILPICLIVNRYFCTTYLLPIPSLLLYLFARTYFTTYFASTLLANGLVPRLSKIKSLQFIFSR